MISKLAGITKTAVIFQLQHLTVVESALTNQTLKNQALEQDKDRLLKEMTDRDQKVRGRGFFSKHFFVTGHVYAKISFVFVVAGKASGIAS